jgi:hypothetical protein
LCGELGDVLRGHEHERLDMSVGGTAPPHHALLELVSGVLC